jgi:hypothetical protein
MQLFATDVFEKRAAGPVSGVPAVAGRTHNVLSHGAYGALPGAVGGALLGGLVGSGGDGESHTLRDAAVGATLGGLATGGRAAYTAFKGRTSRPAAGSRALLNDGAAAAGKAVTNPLARARQGALINKPPVVAAPKKPMDGTV